MTNNPGLGAGDDERGVLVWAHASRADGDLAPDRFIAGTATGLSTPVAISGAR